MTKAACTNSNVKFPSEHNETLVCSISVEGRFRLYLFKVGEEKGKIVIKLREKIIINICSNGREERDISGAILMFMMKLKE